jgi:hypothetical protein
MKFLSIQTPVVGPSSANGLYTLLILSCNCDSKLCSLTKVESNSIFRDSLLSNQTKEVIMILDLALVNKAVDPAYPIQWLPLFTQSSVFYFYYNLHSTTLQKKISSCREESLFYKYATHSLNIPASWHFSN